MIGATDLPIRGCTGAAVLGKAFDLNERLTATLHAVDINHTAVSMLSTSLLQYATLCHGVLCARRLHFTVTKKNSASWTMDAHAQTSCLSP